MNKKCLIAFLFVLIFAIGSVYASDNVTSLENLESQEVMENHDSEILSDDDYDDEGSADSYVGNIDKLEVEFPKEICRDYYTIYYDEGDEVPLIEVKNVPYKYYDNLRIYVDGKDETDETYWGIYGGICVAGLDHGSHTLEVKYLGKNKTLSKKIDFKILNVATYVPKEITYTARGSPILMVQYSKDVSGKFEIYVDGKLFESWVAKKNEFVEYYQLPVLSEGIHKISFKYYGNSKYSKFTRKYSTNIIYDEDYVILKASSSVVTSLPYKIKFVDIYGNPVTKTVKISIDGKSFKTFKTDNGAVSFKANLKPGTHSLVFKYSVKGYSWKVAQKIKVKHILSLEKVNVKKSSKKVVLTASLKKVNGKYLEGKKVVFKFNGKKYTRHTNSKGIAKLTISKHVLKKLIVGYKVKYQATYLKDTIKKSVSVKR